MFLDGVDLRDLDPEWLRRQIGFVPQETFLFSATLAENIAWGVDEEPWNATRTISSAPRSSPGLAPDIASFPDGYGTVIGERGITLSGGQKQRVAIARAILRNPRILILDDALASVDTLTEERILTGLADVMRGRTTILISHRVSTVQNASQIFVIEHGEVAEQGTHAELIRTAATTPTCIRSNCSKKSWKRSSPPYLIATAFGGDAIPPSTFSGAETTINSYRRSRAQSSANGASTNNSPSGSPNNGSAR